MPYVEVCITMKVSDIDKAFKVVRENELDAEVSTGDNTVSLNLQRISIDDLMSVLEKFKPICISIDRD